MILVPVSNWFGTVDVSVTVSDGLLTDSEIFTLTVSPVNDNPVLTEIGAISTPEDIPLTISLSASDIDEDELIFTAVSFSANVSVDVVGNQLTMTPNQDF